MFDLSIFSVAILSSSLGLLIGVAVAAIFFYTVTLGKMKHKNHQLRDACLLYQKQLTQLLNKNKALDVQVREIKQRLEKEQGERKAAPAAAALTDEQEDIQLKLQEERQKLSHEKDVIRAELEQLREEKRGVENSLTQAQQRWKDERENLSRKQQKLEGQLKDLQVEAEQNASAASQSVAQVDGDSDDLQTKLKEQQAAWKRAQQLFQSQVTKLKTDKKALETELVSQVNQAEREKQALEEEIELLTERMMKIQLEQEKNPDGVQNDPPSAASAQG